MGNICGKGGRTKPSDYPGQQESVKNKPMTPAEIDHQRLETILRDMKGYHQNRLRHQLENDPHTFILDNLLMCIQFFDNFERAQQEASVFKRDIEREMTEMLAKNPHEGTILGDRRVKLLTGMSHALAQNYIYKGKNLDENDDADLYYGGVGFKDTFMAEGIIPLEFVMTWDNLEVYDDSEWQTLKEKDYSDPKGASPIARFCMEQPNKPTDFTKGYVRLRCVDEPVSFRKPLDIPRSSSSDFGYAHEPVYNKPYSDGVSEAMSSDGSPINSGATSEEDDAFDMLQLKEKLKTATAFTPRNKDKQISKTSEDLNVPSSSKASLGNLNSNPHSKIKPPRFELPVPHFESDEHYPNVVVHAATPTVSEVSYPMRPFENLGSLHPFNKPGRILNHHSRSSPNLSDISRDSHSPFKDTSSAGSGYESISTRSRASSIASELVRDKWQKHNLKKLWEFGKKTRKNEITPGVRYEPVPDNCYSEIKYEVSYNDLQDDDDDDEEEEDDNEEEEDNNETDTEDEPYGYLDEGKKKRGRKEDGEGETRFYLNSLQVSSNTSSEFHYIGPTISLPPSSITQGVVLGTTIRCPIPYTFQKEHEEEDDASLASYYVTYTFTPSLHNKSWPKGLYFRFNQEIFSEKHDARGEMWPSRAQMEQIELSGCNAIPLGYRSMDFFNTEQILEWELSFQDAEINLLNSFRCPQWRAYIFASIIFRAFIAPLGPQGIGLEHIRNVLYFMCHDDFSGWNDEQPGAHLRTILDKLFFFLSKSNMPSFFIRARNLLQSIPQQNLRFVQGHLSKIRENLIVYSIYAFGNLMDVRSSKTSYAFPNFPNLFEILTVPEGELLKIQNPVLQMQKDQEDEKLREDAKRKIRKKKQGPNHHLLDREESIDKDFFSTIQQEKQARAQHHQKRDKLNERLWRDYKKYEKTMDEKRQKQKKEKEKLKHDPEHRLPEVEKSKSIDLKKMPVIREQFTPFRLLLIIQFFIKHFLEMAEKAFDNQNYGQATMYMLQVENLCEIVEDDRYKETISPFQEDDMDGYREKTLRLRAMLGKDSHQYILARLTGPPSSSPSGRYGGEPISPTSASFPTFTNNWDLRKLPTPPSSEKNVQPSGKILQKPNITSTLQSFRVKNQADPPAPPPTSPPELPSPTRVPIRRQESIKFVSDSQPPETPPRPRSAASSRPLSRQSINLSVDHGVDSTDL